ncbi:MAG: SRPBCC family protein [Solirubrobacteraceae bacterium]|nr:SRPBCC family protein [Solirubrobacteraceae bacterium]
MQHVAVDYDFSVSAERAFAFLAEHENLTTLFPVRIKRVSDGRDGTRNGPGSARSMRVGFLPPFVETTTNVIENELIEYRITEGSPLRDHHGRLAFSPGPDGSSHLRYEIQLGAVVPGLDVVVARALERGIRKGLPEVDRLA